MQHVDLCLGFCYGFLAAAGLFLAVYGYIVVKDRHRKDRK